MPPKAASDKIVIRKVTDIHANWSDQGEDEEGKFSFQLILDNGAEEAVIRPEAEGAEPLISLFEGSADVYFDSERRNVIFRSFGGA